MGRVKKQKIKIPPGKELSWVSRSRLEKKARKLHAKLVKEKHPKFSNGRWQGWWATYWVVHDPENHTAYFVYFEHREFLKNKFRKPGFSSRRKPSEAHFLTVLEYLEPAPCIYMEWIENDYSDHRTSARDGLRVLGAFDFDPLKAIEFYKRESQRCYGGVSPKRYEPPKASPEPALKLRRFDIA